MNLPDPINFLKGLKKYIDEKINNYKPQLDYNTLGLATTR